MLQQHVDAAPTSPSAASRCRAWRRPASASCMSTRRPIIAFLEKPADPPGIPGKPDMALASMGIYVFDTKFLFDLLRRDADDPGLEPRLRQGPDPLRGQARQGGRPPLRAIPACARARGRRLLARRRHGRRLLGGQHRPDRHHPRARPLRPRLADLDLCRADAAGEVRARQGRPARLGGLEPGLRRLRRLGRQRSAARCSSPVCGSTPTRARGGGDPALCRHRPVGAAAARSSSTAACNPRGPRRRRGSRARRQALPAHRERASA